MPSTGLSNDGPARAHDDGSRTDGTDGADGARRAHDAAAAAAQGELEREAQEEGGGREGEGQGRPGGGGRRGGRWRGGREGGPEEQETDEQERYHELLKEGIITFAHLDVDVTAERLFETHRLTLIEYNLYSIFFALHNTRIDFVRLVNASILVLFNHSSMVGAKGFTAFSISS